MIVEVDLEVTSVIYVLRRRCGGRIDEEWTRRKIQSSRDRFYLYGIFAVTPVIAAGVLLLNPSARELFLHKAIGAILAVFAFFSYGTGILLYYMASRYKI